MKKYLAKLLFNVTAGESTHAAEFDEQVRVIESSSLEGAFYKARSIWKKEEGYVNGKSNSRYYWQFIDVAEVYPIGDMKDGEQVYSNTHKMEDGRSYIHYIKQKSMELQVKTLTFV